MKVELLDSFGSDLMVVNAARVSYGKESSSFSERDKGLINYLVSHNHIAPFFHPQLQFRITCPIYVERQIFKTSVGVNINSISGRYVDFSDSYTTINDWRKQSNVSKQGSDGLIEHQETASEIENTVIEHCREAYQQLLSLGVSKEQARSILPLNLNTTFIWTGSFYALMRLAGLRIKPDAQKETRIIVEQMIEHVRNIEKEPFQYSLLAFSKNWENQTLK